MRAQNASVVTEVDERGASAGNRNSCEGREFLVLDRREQTTSVKLFPASTYSRSRVLASQLPKEGPNFVVLSKDTANRLANSERGHVGQDGEDFS